MDFLDITMPTCPNLDALINSLIIYFTTLSTRILERSACAVFEFSVNDEKIAVVFGNEVEGVNAEVLPLCDGCIEIPQLGMKHSLNISVAAGIVLWEIIRTKF